MPVAEVVLAPGDDERADQTLFAQAGLFAVGAGLVALLASCGITPDAVAGHSVGEVTAAYAAGVLSLEDACTLVAARARLMQALPGGGAMTAIAATEAEVAEALHDVAGVSVAAVNGPSSVVISGDAGAVESVAEVFRDQGRRVRRLRVSHAFHSHRMDPVLDELGQAAARLTYASPRVPWACALTGDLVTGPGPGYWPRQAREPVRFAGAVAALAGQEISVFVEIGPDGTLSALGPGALGEDAGAVFIPVLRPGRPALGTVAAALGRAHVHGVVVDWAAVLPRGRRVPLPTYAFQHQRYWPPPPPPGQAAGAVPAGLEAGHPLLAAGVELAGGQGHLLAGRLSLRSHPWLADHAVAGTVLLPGTAFVEMAIKAGDAVGCGRIGELTLEVPLPLPPDGAVQLQVLIATADDHAQRSIEIYSRAEAAAPEEMWTRHASGVLAPVALPGLDLAGDFAVWPPPGATHIDTGGLYQAMAVSGYGYGPAFQGLRAAWRRGDDIFAEVALPEDTAAGADSFGLHPALLDAALHVAAVAGDAGRGEVRLPFAWTGVTLHASGAAALRVWLTQDARGTVSLTAVDEAGTPVVSVGSLTMRSITPERLTAEPAGPSSDALFTVAWVPVPAVPARPAAGRWAVVGDDPLGLARAGLDVRAVAGLTALATAAGTGEPVPEVVLSCARAGPGAEAARSLTGQVLGLVQEWLADERLPSSRLVVVTLGAVAVGPGDGVADLAGAAVWGLVRSAQSEEPGRLVLVDLPAAASSGPDVLELLAAALRSGEPELAIRDGAVYARRLTRPADGLTPPAGRKPWRLEVTGHQTPDGLALVPCPDASAPLETGQVRIAVRAAGLNFRDVLIALGRYPGEQILGSEVAGVVLETGPGVTGMVAGDRVLGLAEGGFGPLTVTDARLLARIPDGWSFAQAASVPVAFATAWYGLVGLAQARPGQKLLVHAAAGGVGMAAVTIGRHLGLEVYGTASPGKHATLTARGLDTEHLASSRDPEFGDTFPAGMDIVLNALTGELTDASLRLLAPGGTFLEMGKTGIRDPAGHPGVAYRAFDLREAAPDRLGQILAAVVRLLAGGDLEPLPVRCWDVRRAPEAFRFMSRARHVGKIVLTIPPDPAAPREPGTVLVTGGTGTLGGLVAAHLASTGRARSLVLASRSGPATSGTAVLAADLAARGARVQVAACDAADRGSLAGLLRQVPAREPLTTVIHAAGVVDDGVTGSLTAQRVAAVMRPKADAAWHLHELTQGHDLQAFILFSSAAAAFGGAGQGSYAAGNAYLDALASRRRAAGLAAISLAWGAWLHRAGLGRHLGEGHLARISRSGMAELSVDEGLALLDLALARDEALLVPARLDLAGLRTLAAQGTALPTLWRGLIRPPGGQARPSAASSALGAAAGGSGLSQAGALRRQLAGRSGTYQEQVLLDLVRTHTAAVLGYGSAEAIEPQRSFNEIGFDSLTAVELRNRLHAVTGLRLPSTAVFEHPTPLLLARQFRAELAAADPPDAPPADDARPAQVPPARFLGELYTHAAGKGQAAEVMRLIQGLAAFRPTFADSAELGGLAGPVAVCQGPAAPGLICFPSFAARPGEYARFAGGLRAIREVSVAPAPGFAAGEPLPATAGALIDAHAENIRRCVNGRSFVLVGHSSGGLIAHALATRLEQDSLPPAAVVLMDTFPPESAEMTEEFWSMLPGLVPVHGEQPEDAGDDAWLTAVAHYFGLDWTGLDLTALPTLLVHAAEPLAGSPGRPARAYPWSFASSITTVNVPGNHFTMMTSQAGTTARAVDDWLAGL